MNIPKETIRQIAGDVCILVVITEYALLPILDRFVKIIWQVNI